MVYVGVTSLTKLLVSRESTVNVLRPCFAGVLSHESENTCFIWVVRQCCFPECFLASWRQEYFPVLKDLLSSHAVTPTSCGDNRGTWEPHLMRQSHAIKEWNAWQNQRKGLLSSRQNCWKLDGEVLDYCEWFGKKNFVSYMPDSPLFPSSLVHYTCSIVKLLISFCLLSSYLSVLVTPCIPVLTSRLLTPHRWPIFVLFVLLNFSELHCLFFTLFYCFFLHCFTFFLWAYVVLCLLGWLSCLVDSFLVAVFFCVWVLVCSKVFCKTCRQNLWWDFCVPYLSFLYFGHLSPCVHLWFGGRKRFRFTICCQRLSCFDLHYWRVSVPV